MFDRRNQILSIILVVQIAVAAFLFWPKPTAIGGSDPLLSDFDSSDVIAFVVQAGDAQGGQVELAKAGGDWVLPKADNYPGEGDKIEEILGKLEKVDTSRLVTQTDSSHARLQVAEDSFNRLVQLKTEDGKEYDIYVGSSAGGSSTHVRANDQSEVYLTDEIVAWDLNAQAASWIETQYFNVPVTGTVKMSLTNANGTLEFVKDETGWQLAELGADEQPNQGNILAFYNQARAVSLSEPIGKTEKPEFGMDSPSAVVTITNAGGGTEKTYTLTIGATETEGDETQPGSTTYIAKSSESPYYVRLAGYVGSTFVDKQRTDFLEVEADATQ